MIGRVFAALFVLAAIAALLLAFTGAGRGLLMRFAYQQAGLTSEVITPPGAYYRYKTVLKVDGAEELVFDNVVACNTRITRSKAHGSSVLNGITPNLFIKRTKDNHAVLVVTPQLCTWARTNTHEKNYHRKGFMPPAVVWFDDADDLTFGIAYVTRTAYANPRGRLELVSTYVGPATREEFEAWYDGPRKENLAKQEWINPPPGTTRARYEAHETYTKQAFETQGRAFPTGCRAAHRLKLTEAARNVIRPYWPADKPEYWTPTLDQWDAIFATEFTSKPHFIGSSGNVGHRMQFWSSMSNSKFGPDSKRYRGGWPAETYPLAEGMVEPFFSQEAYRKGVIIRTIHYENGAYDGFAWCYRGTQRANEEFDPSVPVHLTVDIDKTRARTGTQFTGPLQLQYIFERDAFMFRLHSFTLYRNGGIE